MSALAIFSCRSNSHAFQERQISLSEPIKIGRAVARARPATNNGIFDCKVLSRNHAMLWYEEGRFLLQDTKSSNGTFINNQRLSKGSEESPAQEICSGDLIQFGVDVMENNRRGDKITHGCIIASVALFHPDGREATPVYSNNSPFLNSSMAPGVAIQSQELYQLAQYLQEALHREQMLEQKLAVLQQLVQNTQEASDSGWQALLDEDRLLSRLEVLESQLHAYSKNHTEDTLRQELVALQEDKHNYETTAKESLKSLLEEKIEAVGKLTDVERSLSNTEEECTHLKMICENSQKELELLAEKYQDQLKHVEDLEEKLKEAELNHQEEVERVQREKRELLDKLDEMSQQESLLAAKVESLQADNDFTKEQLTAMKARFEAMKEETKESKLLESESQGTQANIIPLSIMDCEPDSLEGKLKETQQQIEKYKEQIEESDIKVKDSAARVASLEEELEQAHLDSNQYMAKLAGFEEKLQMSDMHMNQMMENAMTDLNIQMNEANKQSGGSNDLITTLQDNIYEMESELTMLRSSQRETIADVTLVGEGAGQNGVSNHSSSNGSTTPLSSQVENIRDMLEDSREAHRKLTMDLQIYKSEAEAANVQSLKLRDETDSLRSQFTESQQLAKERADVVTDLQDQLKKAGTTMKEIKQQTLDLRDRLLEEQEQLRRNHGEAMSMKRQLQDSQQASKRSYNEAEQLRNKLKILQEEMNRQVHDSNLQQKAKNSAEFSELKEECAKLRKRIQAIEAEMEISRNENVQLSSDYIKLQESYKELEVLKEQLQTKESTWRLNLTDSQKDAEYSKQELSQAKDEISSLKAKYDEYIEEISQLNKELSNMQNEYKQLADRSRYVSFCSSIPLLMLLFAILMAVYPMLADLTATSSL